MQKPEMNEVEWLNWLYEKCWALEDRIEALEKGEKAEQAEPVKETPVEQA